MTARQARAAVGGCALASGAAAVALAVVSQRLIGIVVAPPSRSGALVLAAFGAGLAVGAGLGARRADRIARPLRSLAALEAASGAWALVLAVGAVGLVALLPALARGVDPAAGMVRHPVRFGTSAIHPLGREASVEQMDSADRARQDGSAWRMAPPKRPGREAMQGMSARDLRERVRVPGMRRSIPRA